MPKEILEWDKSTPDSLSAKFDELERKRNELWLLKNKPEIARQTNDQRPIEYQTFNDGDGVGSGFPDIAYAGFKNPYDRDPDIATKIDENKYTVEELNTILEEVRDVVFSKSGEEQAKAKLSYIEKYNTCRSKTYHYFRVSIRNLVNIKHTLMRSTVSMLNTSSKKSNLFNSRLKSKIYHKSQRIDFFMSFLDDLEAYKPVAGSKQSEPSTKSSFTSGFSANTYKHPKNPQSSIEGKRIDPRTGDILRKAQIPHPFSADYN